MPRKGSGATTVAKLRAKCTVDRETGCWHYTGALNATEKEPRIWVFNPKKGKSEAMSGAKAAATLSGKVIPAGGRAWMTCRCHDCASPFHVMTGTSVEWGAWMRENDVWKGSPRRKAATTAAARARAILDIDKARAIRSSDAPGVVEARRYGVHPEQISRVRLNKAWIDPNPFQGLGAR